MMTIAPTVETVMKPYSRRRLNLAYQYCPSILSRLQRQDTSGTHLLLTQIMESGANMVIATKIPYCVAGVFTKLGLLISMMETTMFAAHQCRSYTYTSFWVRLRSRRTA